MENTKPTLIVVAGPNGSGKTTITEKLLRHTWMEGCEYINPDYIARDQFGDWNSPDNILKAAQRAEEIRNRCLLEKKSFAFETVLSIQDKIDFLKQAKNQGFFIRVFFIGTDDPTINASRVAQRIIKGGHDVPIPKIIDRYYKSIKNSYKATLLADRGYFYDNSIENQDPELMFKTVDSQISKVYSDVHDWVKDVVVSLEQPQSSEEQNNNSYVTRR